MSRVIHWFRGDLRLRDNTGLIHAARAASELGLVYVLDPRLLGSDATGEPRLRFLFGCLARLAADLEERGHRLILRRGDPAVEIPRLVETLRADELVFNRDTAPYAVRRDRAVRRAVEGRGVRVTACKDRVVFEAGEVRTKEGNLYAVYTPYRKAWLARLRELPAAPRAAPRLPAPIAAQTEPLPRLPDSPLAAELPTAGEAAARRRLHTFLQGAVRDYATQRDRPDVDGTSRLSPYLRFGAISARDCVASAMDAARDHAFADGAGKWLDELIWREFYAAILETHPRVLRTPFRREFARFPWNDDAAAFDAWCEGRTGYPIVDAAMRQLVTTGWVHNRARMIAASFLVKDLLIDWQLGERFFLRWLVDGDPASNNGNWQWAASTGTDAQPYFRIFNPTSQGERFDPDGTYVKRHVSELAKLAPRLAHRPWEAPMLAPDYPRPIVDHAERRKIALERFDLVRQGGASASRRGARSDER